MSAVWPFQHTRSSPLRRALFGALLLLAAITFIRPPLAHAATTWNVTPTSLCTLADAITASNTGSPKGSCPSGNNGGVINLASGIYALNGDLPAISSNPLTITGAGPGGTTPPHPSTSMVAAPPP